jgi:tRNA 5-methylaminomethyl-2-thiouridine biosynthesis bifunctional protein
MILRPAQLDFDATGAPWNELYGDVYASRDGALAQAREVFLAGNRLPEQWRGRSQFVILETGFGLGTNFLATWQAWRDDPARPQRLHFVSLECHPLPADALRHAAGGELPALAAELAAQWPLPLPGLHRCEFDDGRVVLTLAFGDARRLLPRLRLGADAIFLDGFAPDRNPEMWEPGLLKSLALTARPDATLATWCTARRVQDALAASGFEIELAPGFGHKRQRLCARFVPRWKLRRHEPAAAFRGPRTAVVVGAGLAGSACAEALLRRGWDMTVIDQTGVASGASALPWGLLHPHLSVDDNRLARLTRAGCAVSLAALARLDSGHGSDTGLIAQASAVFQLARDDDEAARWQATLARFALPSAWCEMLDQDSAAARIGMQPRCSGLWWSQAAIVSPARWCRAMLATGPRLRIVTAAAARLTPDDRGWVVLDAEGGELASAPVVIAANALAAPELLQQRFATLRAVHGRIAQLTTSSFAALRVPIAGDGHLLQAPDGSVTIGSTYEEAPTAEVAQLSATRADVSNLARLSRLLLQPPIAQVIGGFEGVRAVARDRLPLAGAIADEALAEAGARELRGAHLEDLPRKPGVYGLFALGSRGITLAPLLAELIASQIEGEPWPIEQDLADAVDPARFLLASMRHFANAAQA